MTCACVLRSTCILCSTNRKNKKKGDANIDESASGSLRKQTRVCVCVKRLDNNNKAKLNNWLYRSGHQNINAKRNQQ